MSVISRRDSLDLPSSSFLRDRGTSFNSHATELLAMPSDVRVPLKALSRNNLVTRRINRAGRYLEDTFYCIHDRIAESWINFYESPAYDCILEFLQCTQASDTIRRGNIKAREKGKTVKMWFETAAHKTNGSFLTRVRNHLNDYDIYSDDYDIPTLDLHYRPKYEPIEGLEPTRSCMKSSGSDKSGRRVTFNPTCEVSEYVISPKKRR